MVDLVQQYNPEAEESKFDQVPAGTYEAQIVESAREPISKDKDLGECLNLCWQITSGEQEKRLFWQRLNLWWTGAEKTPGKVVEIANSQFADVRKATGVTVPNNSDELHFIPCLVTYGPQKNNPDFSEVKSVKALSGSPVKQVASSSPATGRPTAEAGKAPWPRKAG